MKNIQQLFIAALLIFHLTTKGQHSNVKKTLTVLNIDVQGLNFTPVAMGNLVRTEVEKLDTFAVTDKYDINYLLERKKFPSLPYTNDSTNRITEQNKKFAGNCYGRLCLLEICETIDSDKMLSGSLEHYGKTIVVTLRLIDRNTKSIEKTYVKEFLNLPEEIQSIVHIAVRDLFNQPNDQQLVNKLTQRFEFDNAINNPNKTRLRLDGPRLGAVFYTGEAQLRLQESKSTGGFDAVPVMFQFGYQFEKQYLNEGKIQALFEFIPMITGVDQGYFIPSFTILHGLRSNVKGWEFALGPTVNLITSARGYYDANNQWRLESDWSKNPDNKNVANPFEIRDRMDSRGNIALHTGFVFAVGRTFKSGKLNIPVNAFFVPNKHGARFGISFGFNAKNN